MTIAEELLEHVRNEVYKGFHETTIKQAVKKNDRRLKRLLANKHITQEEFVYIDTELCDIHKMCRYFLSKNDSFETVESFLQKLTAVTEVNRLSIMHKLRFGSDPHTKSDSALPAAKKIKLDV